MEKKSKTVQIINMTLKVIEMKMFIKRQEGYLISEEIIQEILQEVKDNYDKEELETIEA